MLLDVTSLLSRPVGTEYKATRQTGQFNLLWSGRLAKNKAKYMKRDRHTDTHDRLLTAAASLMWERSFQATGVDEICQRAQAKKGSFYHHFSSKTDLAIAAIEHSWQQTKERFFAPIFSSDEGGIKQIEKLIVTIHDFQKQTAATAGDVLGCPFGNLGQEMAHQDERIRTTLQRIFDEHCDFLEAALNRSEAKGEIPSGDNKQRAKNIFALLEGALMMAKIANDTDVFEKVFPSALAISRSS